MVGRPDVSGDRGTREPGTPGTVQPRRGRGGCPAPNQDKVANDSPPHRETATALHTRPDLRRLRLRSTDGERPEVRAAHRDGVIVSDGGWARELDMSRSGENQGQEDKDSE